MGSWKFASGYAVGCYMLEAEDGVGKAGGRRACDDVGLCELNPTSLPSHQPCYGCRGFPGPKLGADSRSSMLVLSHCPLSQHHSTLYQL